MKDLQPITSNKELSPIERRHLKVALYKEEKKRLKRKELRLDPDYTKHIEWAILATIIMGIVSVSRPEMTPLAIIMAIMVLAAVIDSKMKNQTIKENNDVEKERLEKLLRIVQNEKKVQLLSRRPSHQTSTIVVSELEMQ